MRRETLPESQGAETADSAVPTRAGAPLAAAGSPGRCAVAGLGLGREAPQQARRPSECTVCRGMRTGGGGHAVQSPWGAGETQDSPQGHRIATCTSRSTGAGQAGRPRSPAGRAAHVSGAPGQPARPPARPRLTEPRGPAAPPRRRCAPLSAPCLPSAGWARRLRPPPPQPPPPRLAPGRPGPPRGLGRAPPAPAPHPATPPRQARGRRLRAAASGRHLRRAARSPPEAASTTGPPRRAAEPLARTPRAAPAPLVRARSASASSAPPPLHPRRAQREKRRAAAGAGASTRARGGRKERAHGRLARREASPAVVPASVCTAGGAAGGRSGVGAGSRVAALDLALRISSRSLRPARVLRFQSLSRKRDHGRGFSPPLADPRILSVHPGREGSLPPIGRSRPLLSGWFGARLNSRRLYFGIGLC